MLKRCYGDTDYFMKEAGACVTWLQEELRHSSYGGEESEESDVDHSPPLPRRGRRQAIFDSKVRNVQHTLLSYVWLAISTRPPDAVVSALWASILSALVGLCKEFY